MQHTCVHVQIAKCNFLRMFLAHNYLHGLTRNHPGAKWLHNMLTCFFSPFSVYRLDSSHASKMVEITCTTATRNILYVTLFYKQHNMEVYGQSIIVCDCWFFLEIISQL